jgi:hypothetical protein
MKIRKIVHATLVAAVILVSAIVATMASAAWTNTQLTNCPTEDSSNCFWDAPKRGSLGTSFIDINGTVTYVSKTGGPVTRPNGTVVQTSQVVYISSKPAVYIGNKAYKLPAGSSFAK